tara:strand:- start:506 stop:895 length:390 start_codon:yes stop_codon:yes gene_type:complete
MIDMSENQNPNYKLTAIRGATTSDGDTDLHIESAVVELVKEFISLNDLQKDNIISITFTVTKDLTACFPASIARRHFNFDSIAFLDCQQMFVPEDINFCIRMMALVHLESSRQPVHPYLKGSSILRPDR